MNLFLCVKMRVKLRGFPERRSYLDEQHLRILLQRADVRAGLEQAVLAELAALLPDELATDLEVSVKGTVNETR